MESSPGFADIDAYIAAADPAARPILSEIRRVVKLAVPQAQETISYKMPAFKLKRIFFYFAAFKKHVGVYPPVTGDKRLQKELLPFSNDRGNLKFPLDAPMPYELIARVAAALSVQYAQIAKYSGDDHHV